MSADVQRLPGSRAVWVVLLIAVLLVTAVVVTTRIRAQREEDTRVDELYCTLSGVGPFDRGPKTGRSCFDLLTD